MSLPERVGFLRAKVEEALRSFLEPREPSLLYQMICYHLGWEDLQGRPVPGGAGKAIRPVLCLLACEAAGGLWRQALPAAMALELVHNFSLVHDDIQDQDVERRHRPTVWAIWGQAQAINAGDALLALAQRALALLPQAGVSAEKAVEAATVLAEATLEMVEGQVTDLIFEQMENVTEAAYMDMVGRKTGALIGAALHLGALCAHSPSDLCRQMGRAGRLLGIAFQVKDDVLGIWGIEAQTGKPSGSDILRRKKTLPIILALEAGGKFRETIVSAYSRPDGEAVARVLATLDEIEARSRCLAIAHHALQEALAILGSLPLQEEPAQELKAVAHFLIERNY